MQPLASDPNTNWPAGFSEQEVRIFVDVVNRASGTGQNPLSLEAALRDPSDKMVLETAVNGRANLLVTFNVRDYGTAPARFWIEVMTPREAVERISK